MRYSKNGAQVTERFEGFRSNAYWDPLGKKWTIGYGHTRGVVPGMVCDQNQANKWLLQDVDAAEAAVNNVVNVPLEQEEFDALVDLEYNTGGLLRDSQMVTLINTKRFLDAAHMFEQYDHAGGKVVAGLLRRRIADERMFLKGVECNIS